MTDPGPGPSGPGNPGPGRDLQTPARQSNHHNGSPLAGGPAESPGRGGKGAVERAPRPDFPLPQPLGLPRFTLPPNPGSPQPPTDPYPVPMPPPPLRS
jgi:hypothetical protein